MAIRTPRRTGASDSTSAHSPTREGWLGVQRVAASILGGGLNQPHADEWLDAMGVGMHQVAYYAALKLEARALLGMLTSPPGYPCDYDSAVVFGRLEVLSRSVHMPLRTQLEELRQALREVEPRLDQPREEPLPGAAGLGPTMAPPVYRRIRRFDEPQ